LRGRGLARARSQEAEDRIAVFISSAAIRNRKRHAAKQSDNVRRTEEINTFDVRCATRKRTFCLYYYSYDSYNISKIGIKIKQMRERGERVRSR
jgi:hypothetical protein